MAFVGLEEEGVKKERRLKSTWPVLHYLLPNSDNKNILYTYVRKNACTTFKSVMNSKLSNLTARGLDKYKIFKAPQGINPDISIFVYRDPFDRLVSAYVNKIVERKNDEQITPRAEVLVNKPASSISFRDFVSAVEKDYFDPHVWPQSRHLGVYQYTYIHINDLHNRMKEIAPSIGSFFEVRHNKSGEGVVTDEFLSDVPAGALPGYKLRPHNFLDVLDRVYGIYSEDRKFFGRARISAKGQ